MSSRQKSLEEKQVSNLLWVKGLIDKARREGHYGKLIIHIENGTPVRVEDIRSLQPPPK